MITKKKIRNTCKSLFVAKITDGIFTRHIALLPSVEFVKKLQHYERLARFVIDSNPEIVYISGVFYGYNIEGYTMEGDYGFCSDNVLFTKPEPEKSRYPIRLHFSKEGFQIVYIFHYTEVIPYNTFSI